MNRWTNFKSYIKNIILPFRRNDLIERGYLQSRINFGLSRGAATIAGRRFEKNSVQSWEFSGYSQNGEDGIIDELIGNLIISNKYFIEIGASEGLENNSSWLAFAKNFKGLAIEGDLNVYNVLKNVTPWFVEPMHCFVNDQNLQAINERVLFRDPDLLSLDIDGMDYYVLKTMLENNYRPKILVVEYNSAFGPSRSITVPYRADFNVTKAHHTKLYYGVSISAWRKLICELGYEFLGVESNGVNAFFVKSDAFESEWLSTLKIVPYAENAHQLRKFKMSWEKQFELISDQEFVTI